MPRLLRVALGLLLVPTLAPAEPEILGKTESRWLLDLAGEVPARRAAVFALGKLGVEAGPRVVPALVERLADDDAAVRAGAARGLGEIFAQQGRGAALHWDTAGLALTQAAGDPEPRVRRAALVALGGCGRVATPALATLRKGLADPEAEVRRNAAWALGCVGTVEGEVVAELTDRLGDADALVRRDVVAALAELYAIEANREKMKGVGPTLAKVLRDEIRPDGKPRDGVVLATALEKVLAFGPLGVDDLGKTLAPLLRGPDEDLARKAATALASAGGKDAALGLSVLQRALKTGDASAQELAAASLGQLGEQAEPAVLDLAEAIRPDRATKVRLNAAVALGGLKAKARPALNHLIESIKLPTRTADEKEVRLRVVEAVAQIGYPDNTEALPALADLIAAETDSKLRVRAVWSFLGCEDLPPTAEKVLIALLEEPRDSDPSGARPEAARVLAAALKGRSPLKVVEVLHEGLTSAETFRFDGTGTRVAGGNEQGSGSTTTGEMRDPDARYLYARALRLVGRQVQKSPLADKVRTALEAAKAEKDRPRLNQDAAEALKAIGF